MKTFVHGLVLGKFYPFHAGHQQLVRAASRSCQRVTVQVLASSVESIPVEVRADWIRAEHPEVHVVTGLDEAPVDFDDPEIWDLHMVVIEDLLDAPVDAVFTSDDYGAELARRLEAVWCQVDPGRSALQVSGTAVRADVAGHWWALPTAVRSWFCRRVVVLGAESTGTTTLAEALADHFGVPCTPEFGREWTVRRPGGPAAPWRTEEFDLIAIEHQRQEVEAMRRTPRPLVISDTDVLATAVWHERYVGTRSPSVLTQASAWRPDLYLLTGDEIPFVQDGLRDGEHLRSSMHERFRDVLQCSGVPWLELRGPLEDRVRTAVEAVDHLLAAGWRLADPLGYQPRRACESNAAPATSDSTPPAATRNAGDAPQAGSHTGSQEGAAARGSRRGASRTVDDAVGVAEGGGEREDAGLGPGGSAPLGGVAGDFAAGASERTRAASCCAGASHQSPSNTTGTR